VNLLSTLLTRLNGLAYRQEYLCLSFENFKNPLRFHLYAGEHFISDITDDHVFSGYCPLVLSFWSGSGTWPAKLQLRIRSSPLPPNDKTGTKDALAYVDLEKIKVQEFSNKIFLHYKGTHGKHHFIPQFFQWVNGLHNSWFNRKPGNVFLDNSLYRQVQSAYSIPRKISLVTVGETGLYNLFPTDLHGQAGNGYYIDSLRHTGKACHQVLRTGKMLISEMDVAAFREVYGLGKNHTQSLKPIETFPFSSQLSPNLSLPVPRNATISRELEVLDSFIAGIHRIFLLKQVSTLENSAPNGTLAHIHNVYATWRKKQGLPGNYYLR
jgi:hypothetical protein